MMTSHSDISDTTDSATPNFAFMSQQLFTAVICVDESLHIRWLNAQVEQLLSISRARLLNQSILLLLAPEELGSKNASSLSFEPSEQTYELSPDSHDAPSERLKQQQPYMHKTSKLSERFIQAQQYQQPFINHDYIVNFSLSSGIPVLIDYSVTPVMYDHKDYFIIEMWGKDRQSRITDDQRQQQQYDVARHMLRSVAHEVKNPLAGIRGAAQLLERRFNKFTTDSTLAEQSGSTANIDGHSIHDVAVLTQKLATYTDIIISETDRLTHLIGQLLGSNQPENWQQTNIHETLEHVLTLVLSQYPNISLNRDYDLSLPELTADKDQLIQVFLNLINNACESMTDYLQTQTQQNQKQKRNLQQQHTQRYQPQLSIQTRIIFQHTIGSQQHKQVLQVTVTDNGGGIRAELLGQIFFPMVTSRAAGTGLGLSIVQDIINRHHGMINVTSTRHQRQDAEHKTCFTVYLPFTQPSTHSG